MVGILLSVVNVDLSDPNNLLATFYGAASYHYLGWNVAHGDLNGDGYDDIAFCGLYSSAAYIVFGGSGFGGDYYMSGNADVVISTYPYQVVDIAVGDFNGDGYDDLLLGIPDSAYYNWKGEVCVFYGRASWPSNLTPSSADVVIRDTVSGSSGNSAGDLGVCVAAGDFNGDGYDDLLIQAAGEDPYGRADAGVTYLIYGGSLASSYILPGDEDARFASPDAGDMLYYDGSYFYFVDNALAAADVNGDGRDDILIGLGWADGPGNSRQDAGEVHIVFGGNLSGTYDLASYSHTVIYGADAGDMLSVFGELGDLNSDGIEDLIIGAFYGDGPGNSRQDAGEVYVLWGRASWASSYDMAYGGYDAVVWGAETGDYLTVGSVGDFSGDGVSDLLLGAYGADGPGNSRANCGEIYVFSGGDVGGQMDLATLEPLVLIYGAQSNDWISAGCDLFVCDPNGDGKPNIVVDGTYSDRLGYTDNGQVFVVDWPEALYVSVGSSEGKGRSWLSFSSEGVLLNLGEGGTLAAYDAAGRLVLSRRVAPGRTLLPLKSGTYILKLNGKLIGKAVVE